MPALVKNRKVLIIAAIKSDVDLTMNKCVYSVVTAEKNTDL